jgi:hypothetical protein
MRSKGRWSLVVGRWSLVVGRWSLVVGFWFLVFGLALFEFQGDAPKEGVSRKDAKTTKKKERKEDKSGG